MTPLRDSGPPPHRPHTMPTSLPRTGAQVFALLLAMSLVLALALWLALSPPPFVLPWTAQSSAGAPWLAAACYLAGLGLTLALAAHLTPAAWWRRPTLRGLLIVAGGTWAIGGALAWLAGVAPVSPSLPVLSGSHTASGGSVMPAANPLPPSPLPAMDAADAVRPFRVHRALNLRAGADVGAARLAVLPAGSVLTPTGQRSGDWWQVRANAGTRVVTGWVSSLWLRQPSESPPR